jgi:hypothetical protein
VALADRYRGVASELFAPGVGPVFDHLLFSQICVAGYTLSR